MFDFRTFARDLTSRVCDILYVLYRVIRGIVRLPKYVQSRSSQCNVLAKRLQFSGCVGVSGVLGHSSHNVASASIGELSSVM